MRAGGWGIRINRGPADIINRVNPTDKKAIQKNINEVLKDPGKDPRWTIEPTPETAPLVPQAWKHTCRDAGWVIIFRYIGSDPAHDPGVVTIEKIQEYLRA